MIGHKKKQFRNERASHPPLTTERVVEGLGTSALVTVSAPAAAVVAIGTFAYFAWCF
jgi:hypothetical protein